MSIWIPVLAVTLLMISTQTQVVINRTPSLPYKAFFCVKGLTLQKGDLVGIRGHRPPGHQTKYFKDTHFTKRLLGLPGDQVPSLPLKQSTKNNKPLHPLKAQTVPKGYVFVATNHPDSFDSRYQEFGLVKQEHLCRCLGVWKC